jgi:hypothetical protein
MSRIHWVARETGTPKDRDEVNKREVCECERNLRNLHSKKEESTRLSDTGLVVELEHLKTKSRLIDEKFASVRGYCETSIR